MDAACLCLPAASFPQPPHWPTAAANCFTPPSPPPLHCRLRAMPSPGPSHSSPVAEFPRTGFAFYFRRRGCPGRRAPPVRRNARPEPGTPPCLAASAAVTTPQPWSFLAACQNERPSDVSFQVTFLARRASSFASNIINTVNVQHASFRCYFGIHHNVPNQTTVKCKETYWLIQRILKGELKLQNSSEIYHTSIRPRI